MSAPAARRARLLRLRVIEHRIAAARLVAADSAHAAVANVCDRVTQLCDSSGITTGKYAGSNLQSLSDLSDRLDRARIGLELSLVESQAVRNTRDAERIAARIAEERTARVHASATKREVTERELRAASALSPRMIKRSWLP